jgi:thiol-disulfide isomerase/thioredoxin
LKILSSRLEIPARLICNMNRTLLVNCIAYFFILLFLYTGIDKLLEIHAFKDQMLSSPLLGPIAGFVTWALPITEICLSLLLFVPNWRLKGLYASLILMVVFTIYLIVILLIDNHLTCSCGGIVEDLSPRQHLLFNGATIILASLAIASARRRQNSQRFNWVAATSTLLLFASIGWIIFTAARTPAKTKTGLEGRLLPSFTLLLSDSLTHLNTADIPMGKPFIMVGFSPYCTHCQQEMIDIIAHIKQFGDTSIYFVTPFPYADLKKFYGWYHLDKYPTIITAVDSKNAFLTYMKATGIPYAAIYDAKKRLKEVLPGQTTATLLIQSLND